MAVLPVFVIDKTFGTVIFHVPMVEILILVGLAGHPGDYLPIAHQGGAGRSCVTSRIIGTIVGVWQSYRFFVVDKTFGTVIFHVPVLEISLILVGAYLATLVTTFLPARSGLQGGAG